ncbi:ketoacyl-ACP synthase III [Stutzerimonas urumqiensis]|uniref:ketoacyl-ACP synthase III n=1 Tax=Stutzerimonas urumqiensis TaxID=638269 RepID=UPI003BACE0B5
MIGIKAISSYVPKGGIDNVQQGASFGNDEAFIRSKIGATFLPIMGEDEDTSDLCAKAVAALAAHNPDFDLQSVDTLVVVTQNGDREGLPQTSSILQDKLGLPTHVAAFDLSLACSGYVYGLYVIKGFMDSLGLKNGLLVTADPYSKIVNRSDRVTSLLFGDAATATWIGHDPFWRLGPAKFGTDGSGAVHLHVADGKLKMNGRQVYNFAAQVVTPHLHELLSAASLNPDDVDAYCLHQGSGAIVDAISKRFDDLASKFVLDIEETGNTVSSSIPLVLQKYAFRDDWHRVAISGFGVGLSWGSALLER